MKPVAGKIVIDSNNYYWDRGGHVPALDTGEATGGQRARDLARAPRII